MEDAGEGDQQSSLQFAPRTSTGRRLEPRGNLILHGAGQSDDEFRNYSKLLETTPPVIYMSYCGLKNGSVGELLDKIFKTVESYGDNYLIPQIGLSMTRDGHPHKHYEQLVAQGMYDKEIEILCSKLKEFNRPVFIRIGYEFNGEWNGYEPDTFKAAWIRIAEAIRGHGLDTVALVWCYAPDAKTRKEYMPYYPGDEYVDWWSIDLFSTWHFDAPESVSFVEDAQRRGYPVMIGESTARYVGVHDGVKSWDEWFKPYFGFIAKYPAVKAFCYINWNWAPFEMWSDWGDCRIGVNTDVATRYQSILRSPEFLHSQDGSTVLARLSGVSACEFVYRGSQLK